MKVFHIKRYILTVLVLIFYGCGPLTSMVNEKENYKETINGFIIVNNGKQLLAVSNDYQYLFNLSEELKTILLSKNRKDLNLIAKFSTFKMLNHEDIEGSYYLSYETNKYLPTEVENWFFNSGFSREEEKFPSSKSMSKFEKVLVYKKEEKIIGKRYLSDDKITKKLSKFNSEYNVKIVYDKKYLNDEDKRTILTPITYVLDTALLTAASAVWISTYGIVVVGASPFFIKGYVSEPYEIEGDKKESLYDKYKVSSKYELKNSVDILKNK